jgi:hypothetical protein
VAGVTGGEQPGSVFQVLIREGHQLGPGHRRRVAERSPRTFTEAELQLDDGPGARPTDSARRFGLASDSLRAVLQTR